MKIEFIETKPFIYDNIDYNGIGATEDKDVFYFRIRGHAIGNVLNKTNVKYCDKNKAIYERILGCDLSSI